MRSTRSTNMNLKPVILQKAIEPDFELIREQYKHISEAFEGLNFQEDS